MANETESPFDKRGFNPRSPDAMFATILARLNEQHETSKEILAQVKATNGRVTTLERWREVVTAKVTLIAGGVSAAVGAGTWLADILLK